MPTIICAGYRGVTDTEQRHARRSPANKKEARPRTVKRTGQKTLSDNERVYAAANATVVPIPRRTKCARNCGRIVRILGRLIDAERAKFASSSAGQHVDLQSSFRPPFFVPTTEHRTQGDP